MSVFSSFLLYALVVPISKKFNSDSGLTKLAVFLFSWLSMTIILKLKLGSAADKIYAEDGGIYLQQAIDLPFPRDVFKPYAGYSDITARLLGNFVSIFPVQNYTIVILLTVALALTLTGYLLFLSSKDLFPGKAIRIISALGLILLPIGGFESFGNITNLHFYLMSGCLFLILGTTIREKRYYLGSMFIVISCLSTPLMVYYLPILMIHYFFLRMNRINFRITPYHIALLVGITLQFLFVLTFALGDRGSNSNHSFSKTLYLFFDRVIGSSLIPFWGYVSGADLEANSQKLLIRGMIAAFTFGIFVLFFVVRYGYLTHRQVLAVSLTVGMIFYWLTIGYFFSPEPRYAIFAGYLFLVAAILIVGNSFEGNKKNWAINLMISVIILTWIGSFTPSSLRTVGPTVAEQITKSAEVCKSKNAQFHLTLLPVNGNWKLVLNCSLLSTIGIK